MSKNMLKKEEFEILTTSKNITYHLHTNYEKLEPISIYC